MSWSTFAGKGLVGGGGGCDAPRTSEELPTPMASTPRPPTLPAVQVRQYSWHHDAKKDVCLYDIRREFVGANKQTNRISPFLPQQASLVALAHLMAVVRKVEKSERSKGKHLKDFVFKCLPQSCGKNLMSLLPSRQKSERESQQCPVIRDNTERSNSEMNQLVHVSQYTNNIYTLKPSKTRKGEGEVKFKCPVSTNCQHPSDVIVSDVIIRDVDVNKPVARKRYALKKHSLVHTKGFLKSLLSVCSQTFTKVALMLAIVISILGGVFNVKLPERISIIGTSSNSSHSKPRITLRCHGYAILSEPTFANNVLAGKHLVTYIFPSADFWASRVYYLDIYTVNLESDDNFTVFYDLIYLYMYTFYRSWSSCNWATYPRVILYTLAYFSLNLIVSVIRIHDKDQSLILIGLALTEKPALEFSIFYSTFDRIGEVGCIKEGIEHRIFQKWFMPSHAQVRFPLCSLLLLLFCFSFHCSYCYYYHYYEYLLAKGFYNSSGYEYKLGHCNPSPPK